MKGKIIKNELPTNLEASTLYILDKVDSVELHVSDDNSVIKKVKTIENSSNSSNTSVTAPPPTVYRIPFIHSNFINSNADTVEQPRFTLSYMPLTGVGILKVDFMIKGDIGHGTVIGKLPDDAPYSITLTESQMYVGDNPFNLWIETGSRNICCSNLDFSKLGNKRIIFNMIGYFKH